MNLDFSIGSCWFIYFHRKNIEFRPNGNLKSEEGGGGGGKKETSENNGARTDNGARDFYRNNAVNALGNWIPPTVGRLVSSFLSLSFRHRRKFSSI